MAHETFSLLVRWVHVAAMAVILGGTLLIWFVSQRASGLDPTEHGRLLIGLAENYERLFWLALGLLVMTGVGNLGTFGARLPDPGSAWGERLSLKLLAVLIFLVFSVVRTLVLIRLSAAGIINSTRAARMFPLLYGATALGVAAIVLLAVALAHA